MYNISKNIFNISLFLKKKECCVNKYLKKKEKFLFIYRATKYMDIADTNYKLQF